ncbi:MAG: VIT domain-containing protein, partial [Planctomycetota bacterium]
MRNTARRTRWLSPLLAALAVLATAAPGAMAQNVIIRHRDRRPPHPHPIPRPRPIRGATRLEVRSLDIRTTIEGRVATTNIDEVFFNPSASQLEGEYLFPLPVGAAVEKFSMFVDGKEVAGEVLDQDKARGIYEAIVRSQRDPALLEYVGTKLFRARIFPIPPRSEKRVKLSYSQLLSGDSGATTYRFPLANARHAPKPIAKASLVVEVKGTRNLSAVFSPSHRVDVVRKDDRHAKVSWEATGVRPDRDFTLMLQEPAGELGFSFAAHRPVGEDGTFLLLVAPAVVPDAKPLPRDVVFCLDTSGSMSGKKIEQARKALKLAVRSLNAGDRFAIVTFATEPRLFRDRLLDAGDEEKGAAIKWIDGIQAVGGTCIDEALQASLGYLREGDGASSRPGVVLFVTDGLPTIGEREPARILKRAMDSASKRVRLFPFGVGYDVHTELLDRLARDLRGARDYVLPEEDIEQKVSALVAKTTHAVLTDVTLEIEGITVHDMYPRRLPDLFRGTELAVLGRYGANGSAVIKVRGKVNGKVKEFVNEVTFPKSDEGSQYLGRLWALRRVGHLLDDIRLNGETAEVKKEVVRLSKKYGILTPYTSYLVLESEEMLQRFRRTGRWDGDDRVGRRRGLTAGAESGDLDEVDMEVVDGLRLLASERLPEAETPADAPAPDTGAGGGGTPPAGSSAPRPVAKKSGRAAVERSLEAKTLSDAKDAEGRDKYDAGGKSASDFVKTVAGRSFFLRSGLWMQGDIDKDAERVRVVEFSEEWMRLARENPVLAKAFTLGRVVVKVGDTIYEV